MGENTYNIHIWQRTGIQKTSLATKFMVNHQPFLKMRTCFISFYSPIVFISFPFCFFLFFKNFFNITLFILIGGYLLSNIVLVFPYIDMNPQWVYMCSPSWTSFPSPSPAHSSGSSQCTSPEHPVSCIEPGLVIRFTYDIIHVSVPVSQIIPPSPSPRVQKTVLYICVSFAVSHIGLSLPSF